MNLVISPYLDSGENFTVQIYYSFRYGRIPFLQIELPVLRFVPFYSSHSMTAVIEFPKPFFAAKYHGPGEYDTVLQVHQDMFLRVKRLPDSENG